MDPVSQCTQVLSITFFLCPPLEKNTFICLLQFVNHLGHPYINYSQFLMLMLCLSVVLKTMDLVLMCLPFHHFTPYISLYLSTQPLNTNQLHLLPQSSLTASSCNQLMHFFDFSAVATHSQGDRLQVGLTIC